MIYFEEYKKYVYARVVPERYGYTLLRAGLEFAEEYLEFFLAETPKEEVDEFGDLFFWFAYLCHCIDYEPKLGNCDPFDGDLYVKNVIGCIKRLYRDDNVGKLDELRDVHMTNMYTWLVDQVNRQNMTFDDVILSNVNKLDDRFGAPIPESDPFINKES